MTEENQIEIALSDRQPASECAEEKNAVSEEKSSLSAEKEESCTECVSEKDGEKAIETVENPKRRARIVSKATSRLRCGRKRGLRGKLNFIRRRRKRPIRR